VTGNASLASESDVGTGAPFSITSQFSREPLRVG
jgi:hypothetical protein